jgi:hypothetical protein
MLYLGDECYVVAKEYKDEIVIHIRNYVHRGAKKYPTKHGVMFNILRWLMLEMNRDEINKVFQNGMRRTLMTLQQVGLSMMSIFTDHGWC